MNIEDLAQARLAEVLLIVPPLKKSLDTHLFHCDWSIGNDSSSLASEMALLSIFIVNDKKTVEFSSHGIDIQKINDNFVPFVLLQFFF